ncbi:polysaccharide deacetylase [Magnetococcus marinus MC-1]|uniref:Polysaccharide deacetylase n=1 Tax=Magnetococcus marinus (strain ATCC BAA-1437 / JCM 17883 / MC-1) TaxID=156889 RepID=A0L566_MAGMM|nr:XrtA system polysaccharide deacetylase [Magnetococcus marinus]ABK43109.1 polysaccharide deacetylase [Magnetococcus marinus MC-1]
MSPHSNAFSVDVEDYFQVCGFEPWIGPEQWSSFTPRVEANTERLLGLLDEAGVQGTFFTLGWVAERFPQLVRRIVAQGHELASHGYSHVRVDRQDAAHFRQDVLRTKHLLEDVGGVPVVGYRASTYSIHAQTLWALPILKETGHHYSSSIYPIAHDLYGMPEAPRFAHKPHPQGVVEIPPATVVWGGRRFPCGGGGWFRLLPYGVSRWALQRVNGHDQQSVVFYCHPWEVDPQQPRVAGVGWRSRFRHYLNLHRTEPRLKALLQDFSWDRMDRVFAQEIAHG